MTGAAARVARAAMRPAVRHLTAPIGSVRAVRTRAAVVVLTFDDGPDPIGTPAVLRALGAVGASATFFVLVDRAERHRELVRAVTTAGHEVGLHGLDHTRLTDLPAGAAAARLAEGRRRLEAVAGREVRWFRPPFGAQSPRTWWAARRAGLEPVLWGPSAYDWLDLPPAQLARRARVGLEAGAILLAHDAYADDPRRPDPAGAPNFDRGDLVREILGELARRGLAGRSLTRALASGRPHRWAWFRR